MSQSQKFPQAMIDACNKALDAGVFYQDDFVDFVLKQMGGFGFQPILVRTALIDRRNGTAMLAIRQGLEAELSALPKGHYIVTQEVWETSQTFSVLCSDGIGGICTGGKFDTYDTPPEPSKVGERVFSYEVYKCREACESTRWRQKAVTTLVESKFAVGQSFKNLRMPGEVKRYTTATVTAIDFQSGYLTMLLTRRGTRNQWSISISATNLVESIEEAKQEEAVAETRKAASMQQGSSQKTENKAR